MNWKLLINTYAPHKIIKRKLSRAIYNWADKKYGVYARGHVDGFRISNGVGYSNLSDEQKEMLNKWHFWMRVKNKIN